MGTLVRPKIVAQIFITFLIFCVSLSVEASSKTVQGFFKKKDGSVGEKIAFEIASTNSERMMGLMYRKDLKPDEGMIFVYPSDRKRAFWMKNTYLSLDILFLDSTRHVQGIVRGAKPLSTEPLSLPDELESRYVVELLGGEAAKQGINPGDVLELESALPVADEGL